MDKKYTCFVICRIGEMDSPERKRMEDLLELVITDVLEPMGFQVVTGEKYHNTGSISDDVLTAIREADLCICDVSIENMNVFYELGYCKALDKPVILMREKDAQGMLPVDINNIQHVTFDLKDAKLNKKSRIDLRHHVEHHLKTISERKASKESLPDDPVATQGALDQGLLDMSDVVEYIGAQNDRLDALQKQLEAIDSLLKEFSMAQGDTRSILETSTSQIVDLIWRSQNDNANALNDALRTEHQITRDMLENGFMATKGLIEETQREGVSRTSEVFADTVEREQQMTRDMLENGFMATKTFIEETNRENAHHAVDTVTGVIATAAARVVTDITEAIMHP